jgi:hypothetical protein
MNFLDNKTTISYYFGPRSTFWSTLKETLYVKLENNHCFQYPVKTTVFTVSRKSFYTGCSNLTFMFLYVVIFQQMKCFFAVKTSPNMIGLTIKNIIIKKQLKTNFKVPGVLFCTIFEDCLNADWLVYHKYCLLLKHDFFLIPCCLTNKTWPPHKKTCT